MGAGYVRFTGARAGVHGRRECTKGVHSESSLRNIGLRCAEAGAKSWLQRVARRVSRETLAFII